MDLKITYVQHSVVKETILYNADWFTFINRLPFSHNERLKIEMIPMTELTMLQPQAYDGQTVSLIQ